MYSWLTKRGIDVDHLTFSSRSTTQEVSSTLLDPHHRFYRRNPDADTPASFIGTCRSRLGQSATPRIWLLGPFHEALAQIDPDSTPAPGTAPDKARPPINSFVHPPEHCAIPQASLSELRNSCMTGVLVMIKRIDSP